MGIVTANVSTLNKVTQVDPGDAGGENFSTAPMGFFGVNPIAQPPSAGSLTGVVGSLSVAAVTVTATSVPPNATNEQTFAVTGAAVGQVIAVQKPTVDAGIAIVGVRASATGSVAIAYANDTAASIVPTAGQTYLFEIIPSAMVISATLTPAAVGPNVFAEQQFPVPGVGVGSILIVNKPTSQTGLGIVDARVVSAGVVGITFANFTAATITPTAGESYLFFGNGGIQLAQPFRTLTATLTPVSVAANTTAEQTFTITGLPVNSQVVVNKPSATAGLGIGGARVSAVNTLAINFVNNTSAAITPPSEVYTIGSFGGAAPAAGSSSTYIGQAGNSDHTALENLGLVATP